MRILKDTRFEVGHVVWQLRPPTPSLVVVVKGTFDLVDGGVCAVAKDQVLCAGQVHHDDDPEQSLRFDTDFALFKPQGECLLSGTCYPPGGVAATAVEVELRVGPVSKGFVVVGDRHWTDGLRGGGLSGPEPFTAMPLRWERAFGGAGFERNPVGRGVGPTQTPDGPRRMLPNLEHRGKLITSPSDRPEPAGAFPIPPTWAARSRRAGTYDKAWQRGRWPWLPADLDWAYFNAAPEDQRVRGYFRGDEVVRLQHLHPTRPRIETRLPGLVARAFVELDAGQGGTEFRELTLPLDTITVDADAGHAVCVWRGATEVSAETLPDVVTLFVVEETLATRRPLAECRAWMERLRAAEDAEDAEFEPELPPEMSLSDAPDVPDPPEPPSGLAAGLLDAVTGPLEEQKRAAPELAAFLDGMVAELRASFEKGPQAGEPLPKPAELCAQVRAGGQEVPAELAELAAVPEELPAHVAAPDEPPAAEALARSVVEARHARRESFAGMDLTGADLCGLDLAGADFTGAVLTRAKLTRGRLDGAKLDQAVLAEADLRGASLVGASLAEAELTGADFTGAVLDAATLEGASGARSVWVGARFAKANLAGADLPEAVFEGADFEGARLDGADLSRGRLDRARFVGASLVDAWFEGVSAKAAVFDRAKLEKLRASEGADFTDASLRGVSARDSNWEGAAALRADFQGSDLAGAEFSNAALRGARLSGCALRRGRFLGAGLQGLEALKADFFEANLEGADLTGADLRGANLFGAQLWRARTDGALLELANVQRTHLAGPA